MALRSHSATSRGLVNWMEMKVVCLAEAIVEMLDFVSVVVLGPVLVVEWVEELVAVWEAVWASESVWVLVVALALV